MKSNWFALGLMILCVVVFGVMSGDARRDERRLPGKYPETRIGKLLEDLQSEDPARTGEAYLQVLAEHRPFVTELIRIAGTEKENYRGLSEPRHFAVNLLGEFGAPEAIPVLVTYVDWHQQMIFSSLSEFNGYPCANALQRYRLAAVPAILHHLAAAPAREKGRNPQGLPPVSDKAVELYAWLLMVAYTDFGGDQEAIRAVERELEEAIWHEENLERLLAKLKELTSKKTKHRGE